MLPPLKKDLKGPKLHWGNRIRMEKYESQKKGAPPSTSVLQVIQSRYWGRSSKNLPQNLSVSLIGKYELNSWYTLNQGWHLNCQYMCNYLARLRVNFCKYRDVCIWPSRVKRKLRFVHKANKKFVINIILFKIMLPVLDELFQLLCSIHSSHLQHIWDFFLSIVYNDSHTSHWWRCGWFHPDGIGCSPHRPAGYWTI